jgi:Domain of unknown function (DUF4082)
MRFFGRFILLGISVFATPFVVADPIYTFGQVNSTFADNPVSLGFVFTANTAFNVTSLGWFDGSGAGFQSEHTVGIFDAVGNLVTSTTLGTGTGNPISGSFRYQAITPITLTAGAQYTLAGTSGGALDPWTLSNYVSGFAVNPAFTVGPDAARFFYGPNLVDPESHFSDYLVYAGPNLDGSPVPEPADALLFALGAGMLIAFRSVRSAGKLRKPAGAVTPGPLA